VAVISHEPGAETQWDWVHLPDPPDHWGWRREAYLLVGSLPYSGRWRGWLSACQDQPHLVEGLHQVASRLGGLTLGWRYGRMSTVYDRRAGGISASFAAVAKHYGVTAVVCPPRRGQRKGSVDPRREECAICTAVAPTSSSPSAHTGTPGHPTASISAQIRSPQAKNPQFRAMSWPRLHDREPRQEAGPRQRRLAERSVPHRSLLHPVHEHGNSVSDYLLLMVKACSLNQVRPGATGSTSQ